MTNYSSFQYAEHDGSLQPFLIMLFEHIPFFFEPLDPNFPERAEERAKQKP